MSTTMLYKYPGQHEIHGGRFDYTIVADKDIDKAMAEGWHLTTPDAKAAHEAAQAAKANPENAPPTKEELLERAKQLGIKFDPRWGVERLQEAIAAAAPK